MNYPRIISKLCREPWLVRVETHDAMISALESRMQGDGKAKVMEDDETRSPEDECYSEIQGAFGTVALINVHGILGKHLSRFEMSCGGCSLDGLQRMLKVADESPRIAKVALYFNTPGGTVTGTPETADLIADIDTRKPVIGYTDADCCSGGIYLASQCRRFYGSQSSEVGSVGVRMVLLDATKAMDMEGIKVNAIASGKYKLAGASFKPLTDDEREMFQAESDRIYEKFKQAVVSVRAVDEKYLQGQVYRGEVAAELGFTDGVIDDLDELLDAECDRMD
jgi:signal peptide peptidase SppA